MHTDLSIKMVTETDFLSTNVMIEENSQQEVKDYELDVQNDPQYTAIYSAEIFDFLRS